MLYFFEKIKGGYLMQGGLSEGEIDKLIVTHRVEKKFLEIYKVSFGQTPPNSKGIAKALRKRLKRSLIMDNEHAQDVFGPTESIRHCFVYQGTAIAVCFGTVVDIVRLEPKRLIEKSKGPKKPHVPEIDLSKGRFTAHALEQFHKRYTLHCHMDLPEPERFARQLLEMATEQDAISSVGKVKRIIAHDFEEVRYFIFEKWRFVILEENNTFIVKTIEFAYIDR